MIDKHEEKLDIIKSRIELGDDLLEQFSEVKMTAEFRSVYEIEKPLVSVCIATYNRSKYLIERSVKSVLEQTYDNLELIVVGDCCTDDTEHAIQKIQDSRLTFVNLPERGQYPASPDLRWMVAGTTPMNHALRLTRGDFITHLDDDDEFLPDRLEKLVSSIQKTKAALVWHPFWAEKAGGEWILRECPLFASGMVTTSSVLYHRWFKCIEWRMDAFKYHEPGDWNRFRKWKYLRADVARFPEPLLRHFKERQQST